MKAEEIIQKARDAAQLEQFDSESFREGLNIAAELVDRHPLRTEAGKGFLESMYVNNLVTRLKLTDYVRRHPDIRNEVLRRPVFVLGMPRTGTTLVSNLLAADPARRSLLRWEVAQPVPPPTPETLYKNPVIDHLKAIDLEMEKAGKTINHIHYEAPDGPTECTFAMAHDFKSLFVESMSAHHEYSDWFLQTDLTSAYEYHKLLLQVLQSKAPGPWNLKLPSHSLCVDIIQLMYPRCAAGLDASRPISRDRLADEHDCQGRTAVFARKRPRPYSGSGAKFLRSVPWVDDQKGFLKWRNLRSA
jgi:hypothetical protein